MGSEDYYLELCERPVQFEKANPVNCVFFDEANKQVSGGRGEGPAPRRLSVAAPAPRVPGVLYGSRDECASAWAVPVCELPFRQSIAGSGLLLHVPKICLSTHP